MKKETQITFKIDSELHKELKLHVIKNNTNIKEFLILQIKKALEK